MNFSDSNAHPFQVTVLFPSHINIILMKDCFTGDKTLKIIQALDPNKAHGYDGVSIIMLKLRSASILKPLSLIFCNCLNFGTF